jgi:hypothetical protein
MRKAYRVRKQKLSQTVKMLASIVSLLLQVTKLSVDSPVIQYSPHVRSEVHS